MAITRIDYPTSGTPASNADYAAQNNLIYAAAYRNPNAWRLNNWDNASIPVLKQGLYLRHYNHIYQVTGKTSVSEREHAQSVIRGFIHDLSYQHN